MLSRMFVVVLKPICSNQDVREGVVVSSYHQAKAISSGIRGPASENLASLSGQDLVMDGSFSS